MNIIGSPDISVLEAQVTWDISGILPSISLINQSSGPNLAGVTFWVVAASPTQTPIHTGSFSQPDATGAWTTLVISDPWPKPFSSIEFSGAPYTLSLFAQDSIGNVYELDKSVAIVRPIGNTQSSQNTYGQGATGVKVLCQQASIFFEDQTSTSYQGLTGVQTSSVLKVIYPLDPTYSIPPPFNISGFSSAMVPISYSAQNYQFLAYSTYDYDFGGNVHVVIKYQNLQTFPVLCNIDLMPLVCEVQKLIDSIQNGSCVDIDTANQQLMLINPKLALVFMGVLQPLTGIDVPSLISDIQTIGGFSCDSCTAPTGIIPQTSSVIDGYTFSVNPVCGDVSGSFVQTGTNIQLNIQDKSYVFNIGNTTGTTAFSVTSATANCNKTYSLNVNETQLATDILNTISTNAGLVNLLNSLQSQSNQMLTVNGRCIFSSTATFAYTFTLANIPSNTTFAIVTGIQNAAINTPLNFALNLSNISAFQSYLNSLGIGTFVVTNPSGQNVLISSTANPNALSNLTYSISGSPFIASATSSSTGYTQLTANQVVQSIIDYLCGLTDAQVVSSVDYTINYINSAGQVVGVTVKAGTDLSDLITLILGYQAQTISNSGSGSAVTCDAIKTIFTQNQQVIGANDVIFSTKNGQCSQSAYQDVFLYMISNMSAAAKSAFCTAVVSCGAGLSCAPYNYLTPIVTNFNSSCSPIVGIEYSIA